MTETEARSMCLDEMTDFCNNLHKRWARVYQLTRNVRHLEERVAELMAADLESPNQIFDRGLEAVRVERDSQTLGA